MATDHPHKITIDWTKFDWRFGLRGAVAVLMGTILSHIFDLPGITALSAMFVTLIDPPGSLSEKLKIMIAWTLAAGALTALGLTVGSDMWSMAISVTLVSFLCAAALYFGSAAALMGLLLNYWYLIVLESAGPPITAKLIGFLAGALLAIAAVTIFTLLKIHHPKPASAQKKKEAPKPVSFWRSPAFKFALIKAGAIGIAAVLGWILVGARPFWVVFAPLSIIKPDLHQTAVKGIERIISTVAGGIVAVLLISNIQNHTTLSLLTIALVFLFLSMTKISYTIMTFWLTLIIIVSGCLSGVSTMFSSTERITATVLGVAIAFGTIIILWLIDREKNKLEQSLGWSD